jgi:phosphoribosylformylglycinamidine cyclo-ligase
MSKAKLTYQSSGVNIHEGYKEVQLIKKIAKSTYTKNVLNNLGSFAGMFKMPSKLKQPILVSGTDGVGTKIAIACNKKKYDTVGIDCVAMCVNDVLCHGAKPLFFLDYIACGKLDAHIAADLVKGITTGCQQSGSALIGGETAEMPGFYKLGDYDLAGFAVGVVEKEKIVNGEKIAPGDRLIGIASSGCHSNGFSLIRKIFKNLDEPFEGKPI